MRPKLLDQAVEHGRHLVRRRDVGFERRAAPAQGFDLGLGAFEAPPAFALLRVGGAFRGAAAVDGDVGALFCQPQGDAPARRGIAGRAGDEGDFTVEQPHEAHLPEYDRDGASLATGP